MSWNVAIRIARRELRGGLKGFRVFLACLALGVAAIAAVGIVRESIQLGIEQEGARLLGGDAEIELTYRTASTSERDWMAEQSRALSEIIDFRSMAVFGEGNQRERGLTQIKAIDQAYPLYGGVLLEPSQSLDDALDVAGGLPGAVMDRVLVDRLQMNVGDVFRLGEQEFRLSAILVREPDNATGGFSLGPRTIVRTSSLANSGLIQPGTLFESAYRLRLPEGSDLDDLKQQAEEVFDGAGMRWRDSRNGAPGVSQFVDRLGTFLVLVGLAGLAVGGVGVSAAVRSYLDEKLQVIATLKSFGADSRMIFRIYMLQIGALTALGIALGLVLGGLVPLIASPLIEAQLPVPIQLALHFQPLAEAALYGVLAAMLFTIWPLSRTENIRAATLFRDAVLGMQGRPRKRYLLVTALLLVSLVAAAAIFSGLVWLTIWAAIGFFGAFLMLLGSAMLMRHLARWLSHLPALRGVTSLRLGLASVGGAGGEAYSVVLSLGLGLSVLAAVGQIDSNLRGAIARDLPDVAPSYFVVDIQKDQMAGFMDRLQSDPDVSKIETAPMLRGVITKINGKPASEVAGDHWVISGDRGITYSAEKPDNATLTGGTWWPKDYAGSPQVSFAAEEAEEMGLSIGDELTVNILGRDITAEVTSFREVDFSNAGMGFVLSMNPGAIAAAPHTFIATVYAEEVAEAAILRDLTNAYPNITAIRVRDAIDRVASVLKGIAAAITYGAMATLATGVIVLVGAAAAGERARTYEAAILKTLGASRGSILANFAWRATVLGLAASVVAILAGGVAGWAVSRFVMETDFSFEPLSAFLIVVGGVLLTMVAGITFALKSLSVRPARVLRARE